MLRRALCYGCPMLRSAQCYEMRNVTSCIGEQSCLRRRAKLVGHPARAASISSAALRVTTIAELEERQMLLRHGTHGIDPPEQGPPSRVDRGHCLECAGCRRTSRWSHGVVRRSDRERNPATINATTRRCACRRHRRIYDASRRTTGMTAPRVPCGRKAGRR